MTANLILRFDEVGLNPRSVACEMTIRARGRITSATSPRLERVIVDLIPKVERIVLDLSRVEYIDNAGLGALSDVYVRARSANCEIEIDNPMPRLGERFRNWLRSVFEGHEEMLGMTPD
jgi:anti-anti-sigma factor